MLRNAAVQHQFHIARPLEFLENQVIHAAVGFHQGGGNDSQGTGLARIAGGGKKARKFIDSLKLFSLLANVADSKSLVIHPASTTHSQMNEKERRAAGITDATVRLSVGIEHIDDILADLDAAFGAISRA